MRGLFLLAGVAFFLHNPVAESAGAAKTTYYGTNGVLNNIFNANGSQACASCHSVNLDTPATRKCAPKDYATFNWEASWDDYSTALNYFAVVHVSGTPAQTFATTVNNAVSSGYMPYDANVTVDCSTTFPSTSIPLSVSEKALVASWAAGGGDDYDAPYVDTPTAVVNSRTSATLYQTVSENGSEAAFYFHYQVDGDFFYTQYNVTSVEEDGFASDSDGDSNSKLISHTFTGLSCGTTYNYYARGVNSGGTTTSANGTSFTTTACPSITSNLGDLAINEDNNSGALGITLSVGTDNVTFSSSNTAVVPNTANCAGPGYCFGGSGVNRTVTIRPVANASGATTISLTASDGTSVDATPDTFVLTVNSVNDNPTISAIADQSISEDASTNSLGYTISDVETAVGSLTMSATSSNTSLVPNTVTCAGAGFCFGGSGSSRTLVITPVANANSTDFGTATITVTVTDGNLGTGSDALVLTVNAQNDAPMVSNISTQNINEDFDTGTINFTINDVETDESFVSVSASSANTSVVPNTLTCAGAGICLGGSGANRTIQITPTADASGTSTITVTANDGALNGNDTFDVVVSAADDAPGISDVGNQSTAEDTATGSIAVTVSDIDTNVNSLTLTGTSDNQTLIPNANIVEGGSGANRSVVITPAANQNGSATITLDLFDGTTHVYDTFTLNVTASNDAPGFNDAGNTAATEDSLYSYTPSVTEPDAGDTLTYSLITGPSGMSMISNATGQVQWTPINAQAQTGSNTHSVTIRVNDGTVDVDLDYTITVSNANDAPTFSNMGSVITTASEDTAYSFDVNATDVDNADTLIYSVPVAPSGMSINSSTGVISWTPGNAQAQSGSNVHDVTVRVNDGAVNVDSSFQITVSNSNDAPTFSATVSNQSIAEDSNTGTLAFTIDDLDNDDPESGLIVSGSSSNTTLIPNGNISLSGNTASRSAVITPAANQYGSATITITVSDGMASNDMLFTVTVNATQDAPVITSTAPSAAVLGILMDYLPTVSEVDGDTVVWSINPDPTGSFNAFSFNSGTGRIQWTPALNENLPSITLTADDQNGNTDDQVINVTADTQNDPPVITLPALSNAIEETLYQFSVGVSDPEHVNNGSDLTWDLVNEPSGMTISSTGVVSWTPAEGVLTSNVVTVTVTDPGNLSDSDTFTVTVNAVNDTPTISNITNKATNEDTATAAIAFTIADVDTAIGSLIVSASSNNATLAPLSGISIPSCNGAGNCSFSITPAANEFGSATITVFVSDGNSTTSDSFLLTVNAVNDAPTFASTVADVNTNEDVATSALAFTIADIDTSVASVSVLASSSNPTLIPNTNVVLGGSGANRNVIVTPVANESGSATITLTLNDGAGGTVQDSFVVSVATVNDAPSITAPSNQSTTEDTVKGPIAFTIADVDTSVGSLTLSASSANTTLLPVSNISFGGAGANRTITMTPAANQTGSVLVTIHVSDGNSSSNGSFTLNVTATDDAPTIANVVDTVTNEDTATNAIAVVVADVDSDVNTLSLSASSSDTNVVPNSNIVLSGSGSNRAVVITPSANANGSSTITLTVSDGNSSAFDTFVLTVNAVNDAPTISAISNVNTNEDNATSVNAFTVSDIDSDVNSLSLSGLSSNSVLLPVSGIAFGGSGSNRTVIVTPAADQNGVGTITVTVSDGALTANSAFQVSVTAVNDAPVIDNIANAATNEDTATSAIGFSVTDHETVGGSLSVIATSNNTTLIPNGNIALTNSGNTRSITLTPAANRFGSATITVTVSDGLLSAVDTFIVTVNAVNDTPVVSAIGNQSVTELSPLSVVVAVSDADPDDVNDGNGSLLFSLPMKPAGMTVSNIGVIDWTPGEDSFGAHNVTVRVTDGDGAFAERTFVVNVSKLDSDADSIADYDDNCPSDANTDQRNTDGDSFGNVCDDDDDNDQIPDDIELANGMDPENAADANGDIDGDGLSNLNEYLNCVANGDVQCDALSQDSVAPIITTNGDRVIDATGYVTHADETATANDGVDGPVAVTQNIQSPFRPGRHVITWTARDRAGNESIEFQQVDVLPLVQIDTHLISGEGQSVQVPVRLNGEAPTYPVQISYSVSGSASGSDHNLIAGTLIINSGDIGFIDFDISTDATAENDETVIITLNTVASGNAVLSRDVQSQTTIVERNVAPVVSMTVQQNAINTTALFGDAGSVQLTAHASDPNGNALTFAWSVGGAPITLTPNGAMATFDPSLVPEGFYAVQVTVSDGTHQVTQSVLLHIVGVTPVLTVNDDHDQDGIDDATEGVGDSDGDGVPDYQDPVDSSTQINITNDNEVDRFERLIETETGTQIQVGDLALGSGSAGTRVSSLLLPEDDAYQPIGEVYDFKIIGLNDTNPSATVVIPLFTAIPPNAVFRKLINGNWHTFDTRSGDEIASAALFNGRCPAMDDTARWLNGVNASHRCLRLTIRDGGSNDSDGVVNGVVADPSVIGIRRSSSEEDAPTNSQTGSGSFVAWWSLFGLWLMRTRMQNRQARRKSP